MALTKEERVIRKIKACLSMAKDACSPDEAATAARQARALIDKHQISELELESEDITFGESVYMYKSVKLPKAFSFLAVNVAVLNDCQARCESIVGNAYVSFEGFSADVLCSKLLFEYLVETALQGGKEFKGLAEKNNYYLGFQQAIKKRVIEIKAERDTLKTSTGTGLVLYKSRKVEAKFGKINYISTKVGIRNGAAATAGGQAGNRVNINRTVSSSSVRPQLS